MNTNFSSDVDSFLWPPLSSLLVLTFMVLGQIFFKKASRDLTELAASACRKEKSIMHVVTFYVPYIFLTQLLQCIWVGNAWARFIRSKSPTLLKAYVFIDIYSLRLLFVLLIELEANLIPPHVMKHEVLLVWRMMTLMAMLCDVRTLFVTVVISSSLSFYCDCFKCETKVIEVRHFHHTKYGR